MSKIKETGLYTVWGVVIFSLVERLPWFGIGKMLADVLYRMLPHPVYERLGDSWIGGDWIILLMGAVLGAIFGFAVWLVDSRMGARVLFGKTKHASIQD